MATATPQARVIDPVNHEVLIFEPGNAELDDPVMNRRCPSCGLGLPGKNGPT